MTLTFKPDLDKSQDEPACQIYSVQKLLSGHTDRQRSTHGTDCSTWTTKVVDDNTGRRMRCARGGEGQQGSQTTRQRERSTTRRLAHRSLTAAGGSTAGARVQSMASELIHDRRRHWTSLFTHSTLQARPLCALINAQLHRPALSTSCPYY